MNAFLDAIRDACAANAPDDARERGAQACQTLYAILSTPAGVPLVINVPPPPPPIVAAASGKKGRAKSAAAAAVTAADLVALSDIAPPAVEAAAQSDVAHVAQAVTTHNNVAQTTVVPLDIAPPTEPAPSSSDPTAQAVILPSFDVMPASPPTATPLPPTAAAAVSMITALRNMPPEQLLELAIARLRAALPVDVAASSPSVAPVRFHFIPLPRQGS
jgi:hypothetical protein